MLNLQHNVIQISGKSMVFCHKRVIGMKKSLYVCFWSAYRDKEPLLERQWFTGEKNVAQRQDEDLIHSSFAWGQGINLWKCQWHCSIFLSSQWEHSRGSLSTIRDGHSCSTFAFICSFLKNISIKIYELDIGKQKHFCVKTLFLLAKQILF